MYPGPDEETKPLTTIVALDQFIYELLYKRKVYISNFQAVALRDKFPIPALQ
jgi:hypothetical protein